MKLLIVLAIIFALMAAITWRRNNAVAVSFVGGVILVVVIAIIWAAAGISINNSLAEIFGEAETAVYWDWS